MCSEEEQMQFEELLLMKHNSFAVEDTEFGETDMVEYSIDAKGQTNQDFSTEVTIYSQGGT